MPPADMQWRARKIAMQAAQLADQTRPMTRKAAITARRGASGAAVWARPRVGRIRAWMAVRAARSSISVQESVGPRVSSMLAATARRLDPPLPPRARRWPKLLAGTALLAAGAAAAGAIAMRGKSRAMPLQMPQRQAAGSTAERSSVLNHGTQERKPMADSEVDGLSRTR
jgi:hypothetical protein